MKKRVTMPDAYYGVELCCRHRAAALRLKKAVAVVVTAVLGLLAFLALAKLSGAELRLPLG